MHTIQTGVKTRLSTLEAKVNVLVNYWAKMMWLLQLKAAQLQDKKTTELIAHFGKVPEQVKRAVLRDFLLRCRNHHAIAFLQWRELYPSSLNHTHHSLQRLI